jgi:MSHA biogenesis protein MshN
VVGTGRDRYFVCGAVADMSLINQVLIDLEKRGASPLPEVNAVRVVSAPQSRYGWVLGVGAVLTALWVAAWWFTQHRVKSSVFIPAQSVTAAVAPRAVSAPVIVLAVPSAVVALSAPPAVTVLSPDLLLPPPLVLEEVVDKKPRFNSKPASRLSFELASIPLPASLRPQAVAPATPIASERKLAPMPEKQIKQVTAQQQAENEFRKAVGLIQQGRSSEAMTACEAALQLDAGHDQARQTWVGLLLEAKRNGDAERVLQDGLKRNPKNTTFAMWLARLQVERNATPLAIFTLQKTLPYADQQADYQAFVAALLQRQNRHKEAVTHYQIAVQLTPSSGLWWMGFGISLQAVQRNEDARDAFKHALETRALNAELQAFIVQRLKEL